MQSMYAKTEKGGKIVGKVHQIAQAIFPSRAQEKPLRRKKVTGGRPTHFQNSASVLINLHLTFNSCVDYLSLHINSVLGITKSKFH